MAKGFPVLLLLASAASGAPGPAASPGPGSDIISDTGKGLPSTSTPVMGAPSPNEADRAAPDAALPPPPAVPPPPRPAPPEGDSLEPPRRELRDAQDWPGTGALKEGSGGHDHVEKRGGGLLIDAEGRRLEIVPVKNPLLLPRRRRIPLDRPRNPV